MTLFKDISSGSDICSTVIFSRFLDGNLGLKENQKHCTVIKRVQEAIIVEISQ